MPSCRRLPTPLFLFPNTVDNRAVRTVANLRAAVVALAAIMAAVGGVHERLYLAAAWLAVGLFAEYALGMFGGSSASPLGAIALVRKPPDVLYLVDVKLGEWAVQALDCSTSATTPSVADLIEFDVASCCVKVHDLSTLTPQRGGQTRAPWPHG
jgi:hypothetical protein